MLVAKHPVLRHRFRRWEAPMDGQGLGLEKATSAHVKVGDWVQRVAPLEESYDVREGNDLIRVIEVDDFDGISTVLHHGTRPLSQLAVAVLSLHSSLDIVNGPIFRCGLVHSKAKPQESYFAIVVHHLAIDGVSQRILVDDFRSALSTMSDTAEQECQILPSSPSFREWSLHIAGEVVPSLQSTSLPPWPSIAKPSKDRETYGVSNTEGSSKTISLLFSDEETNTILSATGADTSSGRQLLERVGPTELFLTAFALAFRDGSRHVDGGDVASREYEVTIDLEGHGRDTFDDLLKINRSGSAGDNVDVTQTVGWFTAMYPISLTLPKQPKFGENRSDAATSLLAGLDSVAKTYRLLPERRSLFGLQKDAEPKESRSRCERSLSRILFNFLGTFGLRSTASTPSTSNQAWAFAYNNDVDATWSSCENKRSHDIIVDGIIVNGALQFTISFCPFIDPSSVMETLTAQFRTNLMELARAVNERQQFWTSAAAALGDPAELPVVPPSAPTDAIDSPDLIHEDVTSMPKYSTLVNFNENQLRCLSTSLKSASESHTEANASVIVATVLIESLRR